MLEQSPTKARAYVPHWQIFLSGWVSTTPPFRSNPPTLHSPNQPTPTRPPVRYEI